MPTIREGIYNLLGSVEINTKEEGRTHVEPWPSQRMVIDTITKGLNDGVHEFVVLKSRQMAVTTVCSIVELFWALAHPGTQGAIIADRGDNLERLRRIFASLLQTLPPEWSGPEHRLKRDNRYGLAFENESVIDLLAAGSNPDLGASRALNMMHATECSLWKSLAGVESLKASLARKNPNRLFMWESVANGFNWFYDFWQQAKQDRHMRAVFVGFWANPTYYIPRSDPDYAVYWDNRLTEDELKRARYVLQEYGYRIQPEQIAWWRREAEFKPEDQMLRHFPWHERECFIASGIGFFPAQRTLELGEALQGGPPFKAYKYTYSDRFLSSRIEQTKTLDEAQLKVWEPPVTEYGPQTRRDDGTYGPPPTPGVYAIGIDPSGGGGGESNEHCIQVLRCYADRVVQVAEYATNIPLTYQVAWVLAHLGGAYRDHRANLEVTGIGAAIMPEVRNLRQLAERGIIQAAEGSDKILDMIGNVKWYLYTRPDSMSGASNLVNWKTNPDNKAMIFTELRDSIMLRRIEIRSMRLVKQLQACVEDEGWIGAGPDTGEGDDLVMALALAHHCWIEWQRPGLISRGMTWDRVNAEPPKEGDFGQMLSFAFSQHIRAINRKAGHRPQKF